MEPAGTDAEAARVEDGQLDYPDVPEEAGNVKLEPESSTKKGSPKENGGAWYSVLITQCIQNDLLRPLSLDESLPNRAHVGRSESERLIGRGCSREAPGPLGQLIHWARTQKTDELMIIHIRDWHSRNSHSEHFERFGEHCVANTPGAALVLGLEEGAKDRPNEFFVNASQNTGLNDFEETDLPQLLHRAQQNAAARGAKLRIGVVGVWTEIKVSFLLYDLKTRLGTKELGTCSALTAGGSRADHFTALKQLKTILGVSVVDSVGDFVAWLLPRPESLLGLPPISYSYCPSITSEDSSKLPLSDEDMSIVCYLFRNSTQVSLHHLSGGFSGSLVFRVKSRDMSGHEQPMFVLKLGPRTEIAQERVNFERVQDVLGNNAPTIHDFIDYKTRSGIKFAYAAMRQKGKGSATLRSLYLDGAPQDEIDDVVNTALGEVLGRFYRAASMKPIKLLDFYDFNGVGWSWASGGTDRPAKVAERVKALMGVEDGRQATLTFPDGTTFRNVTRFLEEDLPKLPRHPGEAHLVSIQHGDLNAGNILVDDHHNLWIIDFSHTGPGHVLKDVSKLESDFLYCFTPLESEAELAEGMLITNLLIGVRDLGEDLPETLPGLRHMKFVRAYHTVRTLRKITAGIVGCRREPLPMAIPLLRYALHAMTYPHLSALNRQWALAAACGFAGVVVDTYSRHEGPIRVHWLPHEALPLPGRLGMTIIPGRKWRDATRDLDDLRAAGVRRLLCLANDQELFECGIRNLRALSEERGIVFHHVPVFFHSTPSVDQAKEMVRWIVEGLEAGENVVLVSWSGLGRCGALAGCVVLQHGALHDVPAVMHMLRQARNNPRAIESDKQYRLLRACSDDRLLRQRQHLEHESA